MEQEFEIGQRVKVTDQTPPVEGLIEDVGVDQQQGILHYYVRSAGWPTPDWISADYLQPV